jgi:Na+/H+ antiporter NhaC
MGVINLGIWATRLTGKDAQPLQSVKTVITVVLTVTSGPENSQNKWSLVKMLFVVNYDGIMMMMTMMMI